MAISEDSQRALEAVIDAVADSYNGGRVADSLESTALPNQRNVVEAVRCLEHVVFMGFYSTQVLNRVNLRQHIGEHLYRAAEILINQCARALHYQRHGGGSPSVDETEWSERVIGQVLAEIPRLRGCLSDDVQAAFDGDPSAKSIEEIIFSYPATRAITIYRIAHELYLRDVPMLPRIMTEHAHSVTGIDIHPGAQIGSHFFIDHGTGVVVGETAVIGKRVKLYQGVTLGALSIPRSAGGELIREAKRHPTIEDDVTIYASVTILGGQTVVGRGSVIGANSFLVESVPPNSRVTIGAPDEHGRRSQHVDSLRVGSRAALEAAAREAADKPRS